MHKIYEYLCDELKTLEKKVENGQELSMAELEYLDKLTETKKNLLKIEMLEEDSEYSNSMDGSYGRGGRNSYARGRGRNARRDSMGRYSSDGGSSRYGGGNSRMNMGGSSYGDEMQNMVESIYGIMEELPENVKQDAQRFVKKLEQAM